MPAIGLRGEITTSLFLPDGRFLYSETKQNHITNDGIKAISELVTGATPITFGYMQIGTGGEDLVQLNDPETKSPMFYVDGSPIMGLVFKDIEDTDTALFAYYAETANIEKLVQVGTYTVSAKFQVPLDVAVNEAGIFSGSQTGTPVMIAKQVFSNTVKMWQARQKSTLSVVTGTYVILAITWKLFFGRDPQYEALYDPDKDIVSGV
jgi:hypothetical protein